MSVFMSDFSKLVEELKRRQEREEKELLEKQQQDEAEAA